MTRVPFLSIRHQPPRLRSGVLLCLSFLLPLGTWAAVSYLPFLWHPLMQLELGGQPTYAVGDRIPKAAYSTLEEQETTWFADWQATGAQVIDSEAGGKTSWIPGPDQAPVSAGRRLNRANAKALFSFSPALLINGRIDKDDERDPDVIALALKDWQANQYTDYRLSLSDTNRTRADAALAMITFTGNEESPVELPTAALLPPAGPQGFAANPVFLPAPHLVATTLFTAFVTPPLRDEDPWLHERLMHSLWVIIKGFGLAILFGLPLGVLAGSFPSFSRLIEPVVGFIGYIPPPAFAALLVAILGLQDGPKVGIVFIAAVFPMVIMIANTVRSLDVAFIEAAQTLGARPRRVVTRVIIPGAMPRIYDDLRVLLALGWTILIIAEVTGEKSGISAYMNQMGRYRLYEAVFAAMLIIGSIGLITDQFLAALKPKLFPWVGEVSPQWVSAVMRVIGFFPSLAQESSAARDKVMSEHLKSIGATDLENEAPTTESHKGAEK